MSTRDAARGIASGMNATAAAPGADLATVDPTIQADPIVDVPLR